MIVTSSRKVSEPSSAIHRDNRESIALPDDRRPQTDQRYYRQQDDQHRY
jgi:hypothetical protein